MLLHLYTAGGRSLTLGKLVSLIGEPKTTVSRWAGYLEQKQLVDRRSDEADRRLVWIDLSDQACALLDEYFRSAPETLGSGD